jgi:hypothetical protein
LTLLANIIESQPSAITFLKQLSSCSFSSISGLDYLVKLLLEESSSMIADMLATDENASSSPAAVKTQHVSSSSSSESNGNDRERLPIAEIIMSAHIALLIISIVMNCADASQRQELSKSIKAQLPKKSWWLMIRVLKAFIVLQGKTGVLLRDNMNSILATIRYMETDDESSDSMINTTAESSSTSAVPLVGCSAFRISPSPSQSSSQRVTAAHDANDWLQDNPEVVVERLHRSPSQMDRRRSVSLPSNNSTPVKVSPQILRNNKISVWGSALPIHPSSKQFLTNDNADSSSNSVEENDVMNSWKMITSFEVDEGSSSLTNTDPVIPFSSPLTSSTRTPTSTATVASDIVTSKMTKSSRDQHPKSARKIERSKSLQSRSTSESHSLEIDLAASVNRDSSVAVGNIKRNTHDHEPVISVPRCKSIYTNNSKKTTISEQKIVASVTIEAPKDSSVAVELGLSWKSKRKFVKSDN